MPANADGNPQEALPPGDVQLVDSESAQPLPPTPPTGPTTPSTSYVYPVRSLLAGVQSSADHAKLPLPAGTIGLIGVPQSSASDDGTGAEGKKRIQKNQLSGGKRSLAPGDSSSSSKIAFPRNIAGSPQSLWSPHRDSYFQPVSTNPMSTASSPRSPLHSDLTPSSTSTLTNETETPKQETKGNEEAVGLGITDAEEVEEAQQKSTALPRGGEHTVIVSGDRDPDEYNPRHPASITEAGAEAMAATYTSPTLAKPKAVQALQPRQAHLQSSKPLDFSQTGIVHLPPLPRSTGSTSGSDRGPSSGKFSGGSLSSNAMAGSAGGSAALSNRDEYLRRLDIGKRSALGSGGSADERAGGSAGEGGRFSAGPSGTDSAGDSAGEYRVQRSDSGLSDASSELVSQRFTHLEDEHGFHVITGREGQLMKCEDEVNISLNCRPISKRLIL